MALLEWRVVEALEAIGLPARQDEAYESREREYIRALQQISNLVRGEARKLASYTRRPEDKCTALLLREIKTVALPPVHTMCSTGSGVNNALSLVMRAIRNKSIAMQTKAESRPVDTEAPSHVVPSSHSVRRYKGRSARDHRVRETF